MVRKNDYKSWVTTSLEKLGNGCFIFSYHSFSVIPFPVSESHSFVQGLSGGGSEVSRAIRIIEGSGETRTFPCLYLTLLSTWTQPVVEISWYVVTTDIWSVGTKFLRSLSYSFPMAVFSTYYLDTGNLFISTFTSL